MAPHPPTRRRLRVATLPLQGGGAKKSAAARFPSPLEGEGRVGGDVVSVSAEPIAAP